MEGLEGRQLLTSFTQTNLVSDIPGLANTTDPNLANPWGVAFGLNSGIWVANNHTGTATIYDGKGNPLPPPSPTTTPLVVHIPAPGGGVGAPTGQVANATKDFVVTEGDKSAPSNFIFSTEDGTIVAWSGAVDRNNGIIEVNNSDSGAIYKGLAEGFNATGNYLYATDFHNGKVDVFDGKFQPVHIPGAFQDSGIPKGFAPFGIQNINGNLYVSYAKQDADAHDDVAGPGNGFIDIFDTEGHLLRRFASEGQLDSPWGMAWVPMQGYGEFNNALVVGNFGDGTINAYDFTTGAFLGKLTGDDASGKPTGNPITIPGLWNLWLGSGAAGTDPNALYFSAGIPGPSGNVEDHGLLGTLKPDPSNLPTSGPVMLDPSLKVTTVVKGLNQPTNIAFLGPNDLFVLEKASGKVQHVVNGQVVAAVPFRTAAGTTLANLPVNNASERGLLGIALDPSFTVNHRVYLYWTESSTGAVSSNLAEVGNPDSPFPPGTTQPLGNRVDRFVWDPQSQTLTFDKNLIELHAFQDDGAPLPNDQGPQGDEGQVARGNHNSGEIRFGPDGKLYIMIGDNGRRGQLQNLANGPTPPLPDDQFGGPIPDNNHLTGVVLRLNTDGSTPTDNPFANVTARDIDQLEKAHNITLTPSQLQEVVDNVHKIFSYGRRNGFGLAFDPATGSLWESENGDDAFDEINRITAGSNGGWVQLMGPLSRLGEFKQIESTFTAASGNLGYSAGDTASFIPAMQQLRFPPSALADTPQEALSRLFMLPGARYEDPEFSWAWAVAPAGIGFAGSGLGPQHAGDLFVGEARTFLDNGYLMEFKLDPSRQHFTFSDPRLADKVADNAYKFDPAESESLIAGQNFGLVTDIESGPDGNLYVTSFSDGAIYMVSRNDTTPAPPPGLTVTGTSLSATAGRTFQGTVATFTDPAPGRQGSDFRAVIFWNDGSPASTSAIADDGQGRFSVTGAHRFNQAGNFPVSVLVTGPGGERGFALDTATVARRTGPFDGTPPPFATRPFSNFRSLLRPNMTALSLAPPSRNAPR